jgi:magnesium-transporting ATPase (P-type)
MLCNNAQISYDDDGMKIPFGNPTECALLSVALNAGMQDQRKSRHR